MANTPACVPIPEPILYAAKHQFAIEGTTPEEWIAQNLIYNPNAQTEADAFWSRRRARAAPSTWEELLDKVPKAPPTPGDEID